MAKSNKFGTFGGVFTPSILTILGVIMYLRLPMIVGQAGLIAAIGIIVVAHIISLSTGLSVSSIATDKKVKAGGTYYMISRSLGLPIGGTLGLALFVGLSFSVSLYLIGFAESFLSYWDFESTKDNIRIVGSTILLAVTIITFISTSLAIKTQYFIMAAIVLSLVSIFFGKHDYVPEAPLIQSSSTAVPLMVLFGIFFPAVTGFEAGVSMSGDLKDPKKSIPTGSITAIIFGLVVYIGLAFFFSYTVDPTILGNDPKVLQKISWIPQLVIAGIWGATLSSALGSILGAPRILQATAVDRISHRFFARGVGKSNEPRNALLLTFVIAEAGILIGELDVIARVVSIFFITTYGFLNLSCAFERWTSADFRPEFKTPIWVSLIGAVACLLVMIQLDFVATVGASLILGLIFFLLKRRELALQSGDTWSGVWASLVKSGLEYLNSKTVHTRNWRPNILLFHGASESRPHLLQLGKDISGKLGMLTAFELKQSTQQAILQEEQVQERSSEERDLIGHFSKQFFAEDVYKGIDEISRIYGFSGIKPNTILMGWSRNEKRMAEFGQLIKNFNRNQLNSIFLHYNETKEFGNHSSIDIWWSGFGSNLSMAISIIRYITGGTQWKDVKIRLFVAITNTLLKERVYTTLERIIDQYRIAIEINVLDNSIEKLSDYELIERESTTTDLTIIGLPDHRYEHIATICDQANKLLPLMGSTLLINASRQFDEYDLELEESVTTFEKDELITQITIPQFLFPIITEEVNRLDHETQHIVQQFFEKTFLPHLLETNDWIQNLKESVETTTQLFLKASELEDQFRRNKAFFKIKNEFYFKIKSLFDKKQAYKFSELKHVTEKGLEWYLTELSNKVASMSKSYRIEHQKVRFIIDNNDSFRIRRYKLWKKITHPFSKKTIPIFVHFRDLAEYYLKNKQSIVLHQLLSDFEIWSYKFLHSLKTQINAIDDFIDKSGFAFIEGKLTSEDLEKSTDGLLKNIVAIENDIKKKQVKIVQELIVSFQKEIVKLGYDLEEIHVNQLIREKRLVQKVVSKARKEILAFPEKWFDKAVLYYNKLNFDVITTSFRSRTMKLFDDYKMDIKVNFQQKLLRDINSLKGKILKNAANLEEVRKIKVEINGESSVRIFAEFNQRNQEVLKLIDQLPREMALPHEDESNTGSLESVIVPVSKIARHFFESRFVGQVADRLEKTEETLLRMIHEINDQMNLTRFSIDNLTSETDIGVESSDAVIEGMTGLLEEKCDEIETLYDEICQQFENAIEEAFDQLVSYKIIEGSRAFTTQLRTYQSRRLRDIVGSRMRAIQASSMKQLARVWYSKSEGVLLARRIIETEKNKSPNEKILDIVESVTPSNKVLNAIPHYYRSLFSGRSHISEDFWVEMEPEERAFEKAIQRYRNGIPGGIIITGERNCGKTTLCQHALRKQFKSNQIFHVFPPVEGSINKRDFERELGKATGIVRSKTDIYNTLPFGSVIVIHDMELWWERSAKGLDLVREIFTDIDHYSESYLFVMNMNIFAYELVNNVLDIQEYLIGVIQCQPFDSENLKSLIMKRHESSGLSFILQNRHEDSASQLKMAKLFSKYFDYTKGNPGMALNTWLTNITQYKNEQLNIRYPENPDTVILDDINAQTQLTLQQIALHKRMNSTKLQRVFGKTVQQVEELLRPLKLNGLISEKSDGVYVINPFVEPFVVKILKQRELL